MKFVYPTVLLALVVSSSAQTAPGFPGPNVTTNLAVSFAETNTSVTPPGVLLDRSRKLRPTAYHGVAEADGRAPQVS